MKNTQSSVEGKKYVTMVWETNVYFHVLGLVRQYIMTAIVTKKGMAYGIISYTVLQGIHISFCKAFLLKYPSVLSI